jgi:hypothetical protein
MSDDPAFDDLAWFAVSASAIQPPRKRWPSPIERLTVDAVLTSWLHLYTLQFQYARLSSPSLALASYYERALAVAERRHLHALRMLATVQRLTARAAGGKTAQIGPGETERPRLAACQDAGG